jgi:hypothetical protein
MRPLKDMIACVTKLSGQCSRIKIRREITTRRTSTKHRLAQINLPLLSILHRLRWGLVLCAREEFEAHVRLALVQFHREIQTLVRVVENGIRCPELMVLLQNSADAIVG